MNLAEKLKAAAAAAAQHKAPAQVPAPTPPQPADAGAPWSPSPQWQAIQLGPEIVQRLHVSADGGTAVIVIDGQQARDVVARGLRAMLAGLDGQR